jgi:hypothetical protein
VSGKPLYGLNRDEARLKSRAETEWRRHLRRAIRLARRVEALRFTWNELSENPLALVTFEMLVQTRRLAEAIDQLGTAYSYEAQALARAMLETWVNARWIRLREPRRRAARFIKHEGIEGLRLLESVPEHDRPAASQHREREWRRWAGVARRAQRRSKRGGAGHGSTGSGSGGRREQRLQDIAPAIQRDSDRPEIDAANRTTLYFVYRVLSQPPHGSQLGLTPLLAVTRRGPVAARQPAKMPLLPVAHAAACVLTFIGWAQLDLSPVYKQELSRLLAENATLLEHERPARG